MTQFDFTFDEKTGELSRGGKRLALKYRHVQMFSAMRAANGDYVTTRSLCDLTESPKHKVANEALNLRRRIERLGMSVAGKHGVGYRLIVGPMPKWQPNIPPPAILESME